MKKRLDALTRIGRLQALMHDLGRWRLSAIEQQQAGLGEDLRAVFEALQTGELAYGPQARLAARRHSRAAAAARLARPRVDPVREKAKAQGVTRANLPNRPPKPQPALSRGQGAQGAGRAHRARDRPPQRKLDIRLQQEVDGTLALTPAKRRMRATRPVMHGFQSPLRRHPRGPERGRSLARELSRPRG